MKQSTLKNFTHAHAWLGLITSGVLMIVFVCGSMSFFRENIVLWDMQYDAPKTDLASQRHQVPVSTIAKQISNQGHTMPADHGVFIELPTQAQPFYVSYFEIETPEGEHVDVNQSFDPETGQRYELDQADFYLGNMLYRMHISLMLPGGTELVGIVSLIFFVMVFTGTLILLKKIISHYYQYRVDRRKDTYLDGHSIIGISTLPYTFLFALTGVMFNLSILLQAGFGFAVFKGNIPALMATADFYAPPRITELSGQPADLTLLDDMVEDAKRRYPEQSVYFLNIFAPNDQAGQVEVAMTAPHTLDQLTRLTYSLADGRLIKEYKPSQSATAGTYSVLSSLHFGEYGGNTLKFIYFLLGLACCYMILTGNLIWLEKRENNRKQSKRGLQFVKAMTLALSSGTLIAVASTFIAARFAPESWSQVSLLPPLFGVMILVCLIHGWFSKNVRGGMIQQLYVAAILALICPLYDLIQMLLGHTPPSYLIVDVWLVTIAQVLVAGFCLLLVRHHRPRAKTFNLEPAIS